MDVQRGTTHRELRGSGALRVAPRGHPRRPRASGDRGVRHRTPRRGTALRLHGPAERDAPGAARARLPAPPAVHDSPAQEFASASTTSRRPTTRAVRLSAGTSVGFLLVARNFPLDPVEEARRYQLDLLIQAQDQPVVEAQRPHELPLDLSGSSTSKARTRLPSPTEDSSPSSASTPTWIPPVESG